MLEPKEEEYLKNAGYNILKLPASLSRYDEDVVRNLTHTNKTLTHGEANLLKKVIVKYEILLKKVGYSLKEINKIDANIYKENGVSFWYEGKPTDKSVVLRTPYNKEFVELIKSLPTGSREWDFDNKVWRVKLDYDAKNLHQIVEWINECYGTDFEVVVPDIRFGSAYIKDDKVVFDVCYDEDFNSKLRKFSYHKFDGVWNVGINVINDIYLANEILDEYDIESEGVIKYLEQKESHIYRMQCKREEIVELSNKRSLTSDYEVKLPSEDLSLYPFQKYAVKMLDLRGKGLIADEPGLGKTIEVLTHINTNVGLKPVLAVVPANVKIKWQREIVKWTNSPESDIYIFEGQSNVGVPDDCNWYIINYEILHHRMEDLRKIHYNSLIIDESHFIKSHKSKRTKAVLNLADKVEHVYCLTGTPILSYPVDLFTQLQTLKVNNVPEFIKLWGDGGYANKFCGACKMTNGQGKTYWDLRGSTNVSELEVKLRENVMIRRKKEDVLDELPAKRRIEIPLDIDNRGEYMMAVNNFREWLERCNYNTDDLGDAQFMVQTNKLRELAWKGKYNQMVEWIDNLVEQEGKIVIWAHHQELQRKLHDHYIDRAVYITGGMTTNQRQESIDRFMEDDNVQICVASIQSAGVGIDLFVSSCAVFTEVMWTPGVMYQAEDRIHRIGQQADKVEFYYMLAYNTIDEIIMNVINRKQEVLDQAIDGKTVPRGFKMDFIANIKRGRY